MPSIDRTYQVNATTGKMISDDDLYKLAIVLGSIAMLLIVVYHWLEVNSIDDTEEIKVRGSTQVEAVSGSIAR